MDPSSYDIPMKDVVQSPEIDFAIPINDSNFKNKTICITGGSSGFGAAMLRAWAQRQATVVIGDINEAAGLDLVARTRQATGNDNLHFFRLDVTDWSSQVAFFAQASKVSLHGGIDCVVANAGVGGGPESREFEKPPDFTKLSDPKPPQIRTIDVNLVGLLYTTHLAMSYLSRNPGSQKCSVDRPADNRDRHLILIASMAGLLGAAGISLYCTSKHAVVGLFRALRITCPIRDGIRVNMICPYFVQTPILGAAGSAIMAGSGVADIQDVIEAATRFVADQSIIGRAVAVGPKVDRKEALAVGLEIKAGEGDQKAVWDVYGHDFEQSDVFVRKIVGLTNLVAKQKGWIVYFQELAGSLAASMGWSKH